MSVTETQSSTQTVALSGCRKPYEPEIGLFGGWKTSSILLYPPMIGCL